LGAEDIYACMYVCICMCTVLGGYTPVEGYFYDTSGREGGDGGDVESACRDVDWELNIYLCMYACMCVCVCTVGLDTILP